MSSHTAVNESPWIAPFGQMHRTSSRTGEEWISLVRVLLLLSLIPAIWFEIITVPETVLDAITVLIASYVVLLALRPRWLAPLWKPDLVIVLDLLVITLVVVITGTVNSPFLYLYYLAILQAAARFNLRQALAASLAMTAMIILLWMRTGNAGALDTMGFRLGAFIASGFFLALLLGMLFQESRAARERLEELQFDSVLANRLSGELEVERVLDTLLEVFLDTMRLSSGVAYVIGDDGEPRQAATRGEPVAEPTPDDAAVLLPPVPEEARGGEVIVHSVAPRNGSAGSIMTWTPLVRAGQLRAWLCGFGQSPVHESDHIRRRLFGMAAQGVATLEAARLHEQVKELAATDWLTGLPNRRCLLDRLASELAYSNRTGRPLSAALIDLNGFKGINDTHGHSVGDAALIRMAKALKRSLRRSDLAARFGGDEFILLLPETTIMEAEAILDRLGVIETSIAAGRDRDLRISFCWGIAAWPQDGSEPEQLLQMADRRLYAMKQRVQAGPVTPGVAVHARS